MYFFSGAEQRFVSVERIRQYIEKNELENLHLIEKKKQSA